ncbi:large ribosomal subunit protein bL9-like [Argopecten irradians]|uniref:large ribosomal subunit protein bL9-like n=1 Tax=Argopecten irradians TaxID=31199 RepID=UPI0037194733
MFRSVLQAVKSASPGVQPCPSCLQRLMPASVNSQPVRTTITVERVNKVGLHKNTRHPRLKTRHFIYKPSIDSRHSRLIDAKVILLQDVKNIGQPGDVIDVRQAVFYRKLYPLGQAVFATEANMDLYDELIKRREIEFQKTKEQAQKLVWAEQLANDLTGMRLPIAVNKSADSAVTSSHILVALWKAGIEANENCIKMESVTDEDEIPLSLTVNDTYTAKFTGVIYRVDRDSEHLIPSQLDGFLKRTSITKKDKTS